MNMPKYLLTFSFLTSFTTHTVYAHEPDFKSCNERLHEAVNLNFCDSAQAILRSYPASSQLNILLERDCCGRSLISNAITEDRHTILDCMLRAHPTTISELKTTHADSLKSFLLFCAREKASGCFKTFMNALEADERLNVIQDIGQVARNVDLVFILNNIEENLVTEPELLATVAVQHNELYVDKAQSIFDKAKAVITDETELTNYAQRAHDLVLHKDCFNNTAHIRAIFRDYVQVDLRHGNNMFTSGINVVSRKCTIQ